MNLISHRNTGKPTEYNGTTCYTGTSTEHRATFMSNAHKLKRLFTFYEATSKPCIGI